MKFTFALLSVLLSLSVFASPEDELAARLPEIFRKSAAHYRALDAAATPLMRDEKGECRTPHGMLKWKTGKSELDMQPVVWWTAGHFPGSLWYLYEATGDDFFKTRATAWTEILEPAAEYEGNHDIGFITYCSYGNARRLLKTNRYDALLRKAANTLCKRYHEKLGLIRSWGKADDDQHFLVIPDNLMNLELLEWAAGQADGTRFARIAESHADVTMRNHFRDDGGCYHVLDYDQARGSVMNIGRGQGDSCRSSWSRGQSWAIYGYTMMYRMSGYVRYLDFAKKVADYAINNPNMPKDGIPCWDYGVADEERDSSAGSIMASALMELSQYVGEADCARYRGFAVKQLLSLSSPDYFSEGDEVGHFLLKHGVGKKLSNLEVDTPLDYGDYYFLEALLRFRALKAREVACATVADKLPRHAELPKDELVLRTSAATREGFADVAVRALTDPIPDTSDALYEEFWTIGNRTHYEAPYFARLHRLDALALAEAEEGKGRFLGRLEDYIAAICDMKSWVLPAHDNVDGNRGTFRGTVIQTDLFSTEVAAHLACVLKSLGGRLRPENVARVKAECERRVFAPVRREAPALHFPGGCADSARVRILHWANGRNNWNAVCWDNVVCAACGLLDNPADRAFFVVAADRAADSYIANGFAEDGYCSEGMGYWNYGFGHHLLTGRLLHELSDGKIDYFHRPKQRLAAAYARAYTLCEGTSPAFADGNGAADPFLLKIVDRFWLELPKALPPVSEFPDGQVWLFRDPDGLSVGFKGGHNDEHHNHNDIGSYYVVSGDRFVAGDPGGEVYTARTFSARRYESKVLNSYGHPVPVVGGKLQSTGRTFAAKVLSKDLVSAKATVVLDMTKAYEVPTLKSLTRTFVYDRAAKTFAVRDHAVFSEPTAFEDCVVSLGDGCPAVVNVVKGGALTSREEKIDNPGRQTPRRHAFAFADPVPEAEIEFAFSKGKE